MERKIFELLRFRGNRSSLFTGRPQGEQSRIDLELDKYDKSNEYVEFVIPKGTSSFNPSFYLGLLYDSLKKLGLENFEQKYTFRIEDDNPEIVKVLKNNLEDGKRYALNEIEGKTGLDRFLNN